MQGGGGRVSPAALTVCDKALQESIVDMVVGKGLLLVQYPLPSLSVAVIGVLLQVHVQKRMRAQKSQQG